MDTYYVVRSSRPTGLFCSASSTDCTYAYVGRTCEKPRRASVSNACDGIHELSGLDRPRITNDAYPTNGYSHTYAEASRVLRFRAREFRTTVLKREMEMLGEIRCTRT
jgi:hypothetical protein